MRYQKFTTQERGISEGPSQSWRQLVEVRGDGKRTPSGWVVLGDPSTPGSANQLVSTSSDASSAKASVDETFTSLRLHQAAKREQGQLKKFALHNASPEQEVRCVVYPFTQPGTKGEWYAVEDGQRHLLCRIHRGRSASGLRRAWRMEVTSSGEVFTGYRGTWTAWVLFALLIPLWIPLTLLAIALALLDAETLSEGLTWRPPIRTTWRQQHGSSSTVVLEYMRAEEHRFASDLLDERIAHAQGILRMIR